MTTENILKSVIDKYEISVHMSNESRAAMNRSKRKNLSLILKKQARGIIFLNATVAFFLWVKKYGLSLSFAKSAIVVTAAALAVAGIVSYTAVFSVKTLIDRLHGSTSPAPVIEQTVEVTAAEQDKERPVLSYAVAVNRVTMSSASASTRSELTGAVISGLCSLKGRQAAISSSGIDAYHVSQKELSVTVIKLGGAPGGQGIYRVSAKVINSADSRVLLLVSETAAGEDKIKESIKVLMQKVSAVL